MSKQWRGQTGGTHAMQRALVTLIKHTDIRVAYTCMHLWLVWYILVRPTERHGAYLFHRRRGRNPLRASIDVYRSFYHFGKAIVDRFAVYAGVPFQVQVENPEHYYGRVHSHEGFIMLFSHLGNTEMAGYFLATPDKRLNILAYGGESPVVMAHRAQVLARNNIGLITVQPDDIQHIYRIHQTLQAGEILAMAADRRMGERTVNCTFMGKQAAFPSGAFQICQTTHKPVLLVFVIKEKARSYRVLCELLPPDDNLPRRYAEALEKMALQYPYEWFNFYDFWTNEK